LKGGGWPVWWGGGDGYKQDREVFFGRKQEKVRTAKTWQAIKEGKVNKRMKRIKAEFAIL